MKDFDPREVSNVDKKGSARGVVMYLAEKTSLWVTKKSRHLENSKVPDAEVSLSFLLTRHHFFHLNCLEGNIFSTINYFW